MNRDQNPCWARDWEAPSEASTCRQIIDQVLQQLADFGWHECEQFAIHLALEEAISNAICHGNRNDPGKRLQVRCEVTEQRFRAMIQDEGTGFDPATIPDCTCDENLDKPGGRGLFLIQRYMDRVCYEGRGNRLIMEKCRGEAGP